MMSLAKVGSSAGVTLLTYPEVSMKELLAKWSNNHWSVDRPETYVIRYQGRVYGLGVCAATNMAAFNMAWGLANGALNTPEEHVLACRHFTSYVQLLSQEVKNYPLSEWVCMMQPVAFNQWLDNPEVGREVRKYLRPPTLRAIRMQETANDLR